MAPSRRSGWRSRARLSSTAATPAWACSSGAEPWSSWLEPGRRPSVGGEPSADPAPDRAPPAPTGAAALPGLPPLRRTDAPRPVRQTQRRDRGSLPHPRHLAGCGGAAAADGVGARRRPPASAGTGRGGTARGRKAEAGGAASRSATALGELARPAPPLASLEDAALLRLARALASLGLPPR